MKELALNIGEEFWLKPHVGIEPSCWLTGWDGRCLIWKGIPAYSSIGALISAILPNIYILAGLILFFLLIGGGLMVIVSAGQENPEGVGKGKQTITVALIGFLFIFASYWLMQIIKVLTGVDILGGGGL